MSKATVIAIEPHDGKQPGQRYEIVERIADELVRRGLVKMAVPARNKMRPDPINKGDPRNPTPAAGRVQPSSALPVAQASHETTASASAPGETVRRGPGRPRKIVELSPSTTPMSAPDLPT